MLGKLTSSPGIGILPPFSRFFAGVAADRRLRMLLAALAIAALLAGAFTISRSKAAPVYQTQTVLQQDLTQSVTASGTVNPQNTVTVGTQVSGTISQIFVDFNSKVRQGQVLAKLDTSQLAAQLQQAQASLAQAQAQASAQQQTAGAAQANIAVSRASSAAQTAAAQAAQAGIATADANVTKSQSALRLAQQTVSRDKSLLANGYIAQSQLDADQSNAVAAQSALQASQAAAAQARAQAASSVNQAQAANAQASVSTSQAGASSDNTLAAQAAVAAAQAQVAQDQLNMQRAVITSPVDGTVIDRAVSVGQTVAASLQTPTLFTIAQNLNKMEVDIAVGEPDIGNVRPGDTVNFSVLAYPNQTFRGTVQQVRENPTTVSNVVTYTVITYVENTGNKLMPGMTANATINVQTQHGALVVPAQALSYRPSGSGKHTHRKGTSTSGASTPAASSTSPWGQTTASAGGAAGAGASGLVFVLDKGKAKPVRVQVTMVSGTQAAVTPVTGTLSAGDEVIVADGAPAAQASGSSRSGASSGGPGGMGGIGRAIR
ncbi:MAG TPA: efflux RND transporter periplasmic adaptor subunit [Candidatus Baltobacteraceae bacterium]|nr:efflux RND transporter periplasmic adaptor subunit [Candidatus Baltobacteraceae bacterium]